MRCRRFPRALRIGASSRAPPRKLFERLWWDRSASRDLVDTTIAAPDRGQGAAPQAPGIEHQQIRRELQFERRPVAADDRRRGRPPVLELEPRSKAGGRHLRSAFLLE